MNKNKQYKLKNRIRELRRKKGLSQEQLAALVSTSQNTISALEIEKSEPTAFLSGLICHALDCSWDECFYYENKKYFITDHLGNTYKSIKEMCNAYNIHPNTYQGRLKRGWTKEEALLDKKITDHLGNGYKSIKEMCEAYNISYDTYLFRIRSGWAKEAALTALNIKSTYKDFRIINLFYNEGMILYKVKHLKTNEEMILTKEMMDNYNE